MKNIAVIGQGYVGLPVAMAAAEAGYLVVGIDINQGIIEKLNSGFSVVEDVSNFQVSRLINNKKYSASNDFHEIRSADVILICVPTPITKSGKPDLSFLTVALESVAINMKKDCLVILESTVEPGTTRNYMVKLLEDGSGYRPNEFDIAFSPERIDPANKVWNLTNTPKLVAGLTKKSKHRTINFYCKFIDNIVECESLEVAETAKLLENSFRLINISFINELLIFCNKLNIDVNDVISAASTKPYGFMSFYPSLGVGGHCIPVDPLYLANKAQVLGVPTEFIDLAVRINKEMPVYFADLAEKKLGSFNEKKILVVGVAYKPNVSDVRETPVEALITKLNEKGAKVFWHDDLVKEWNGDKSVALSSDFDLAIIATPHDYLDLTKLGNMPILNTRGSI